MLWACLHFPQLPIDRHLSTNDNDMAIAIVGHDGARKQIIACNSQAQQRGIHAGLALNNAYAIVPDLHVNDYNEDEQQAHIKQLALWALQYSSWVTPRLPDNILIEVKASLKLYGGLNNLLDKLHTDANEQGLVLKIGTAPTPAAAILLARLGQDKPVQTMQALPKALANIAVQHLVLDAFTLRGLRQSGIATLQQLRDMPVKSLARRFGHECTDLLYKLYGDLPDSCPAFDAPETFSQAFDLSLEAPDTNALTFPLNRLINALGGYLKNRDLGVQTLEITMYHHRHAPTTQTLQFLDATANTSHLLKVATERLGNTILPEPVTRLNLHASNLSSVDRAGKDLFQKSQAQSDSVEQVLDKLMARLGKQNLYTAMPHEDHRPEKAWMAAMLEESKTPTNWPARPLWLLREPRLATEALKISSSTERIENGWWGDTDVRRDYFIARNRNGCHFWVYRQRRAGEQQLYIHGIFA